MSVNQDNRGSQGEPSKKPAAGTGNASNPSPHDDRMEPANSNQLLDEKAEKYLREVANIEDVPDAQEQQDAERRLEEDGSGI